MDGELVAIMAWKPYASLEETRKAIDELEAKPTIETHKYFLALPFQYLSQLPKDNASDHLIYGSASMTSIAQDSFTSAIAGQMLKQLGAHFVLIGTSYNRQHGDRDSETIRQKILRAIDADVVPFLCIGENIKEYEKGRSEEVLREQLVASTKDFTEREWNHLKIVYEAPWINATSSMPTWEALNRAYHRCTELVQEVCGVSLPVFCGVPDDIVDLVDFVQGVQANGYFFSHANLHLDLFSKGLHLAMPSKAPSAVAGEELAEKEGVTEVKAVEKPKKSFIEEEPEKVAAVVGSAVLAAAHEVEESEEEAVTSEIELEAPTIEEEMIEQAEAPPEAEEEAIEEIVEEAAVEEEEVLEAPVEVPVEDEEVLEAPVEAPMEEEIVEEVQMEAPALEDEIEEFVAQESEEEEEAQEKRRIMISDISKPTKELRHLDDEV